MLALKVVGKGNTRFADFRKLVAALGDDLVVVLCWNSLFGIHGAWIIEIINMAVCKSRIVSRMTCPAQFWRSVRSR